jgi:hypothetical protein
MANQIAVPTEGSVATGKVSRLFDQAVAKLAKAKTAAEVLDAICSAKIDKAQPGVASKDLQGHGGRQARSQRERT